MKTTTLIDNVSITAAQDGVSITKTQLDVSSEKISLELVVRQVTWDNHTYVNGFSRPNVRLNVVTSARDISLVDDPAADLATLLAEFNGLISQHDLELINTNGNDSAQNLVVAHCPRGEFLYTWLESGNAVADDVNLYLTEMLEAGSTSSTQSRVDSAEDKVDTYSYLSPGTSDERVSTIVTSSASLALSYTTTFTYAGSSGSYRVATVTRS